MNFDENSFGQLWPDNLEPLNKLSNKSPNFLLMCVVLVSRFGKSLPFRSCYDEIAYVMLCYVKNHEILENLLDWQLRFITILVTVEVYLHLFTVFLCISLNRCILGEAKVGS